MHTRTLCIYCLTKKNLSRKISIYYILITKHIHRWQKQNIPDPVILESYVRFLVRIFAVNFLLFVYIQADSFNWHIFYVFIRHASSTPRTASIKRTFSLQQRAEFIFLFHLSIYFIRISDDFKKRAKLRR